MSTALSDAIAPARPSKNVKNWWLSPIFLPNGFEPVLWDRTGLLRDDKSPTPGPVEVPSDSTSPVVRQRYTWFGSQLLQRETYRDRLPIAPSRITRFVTAYPDGGGPRAFVDDDGTIDIQMADHAGKPWFMIRAREGRHTWLDLSGRNPNCRSTGILEPPALRPCPFTDYTTFAHTVLEEDFLMGRRGVMGWNGDPYDSGLYLLGENVPAFEQSAWERFLQNVYENPWRTLKYVAAGVVIVIGGVALTIVTGGLAGFVIGGAIAGFGMGFGVTGAVTNNFGAALQAGAIGAVAGGVGGAAGYAVGFGANAGLQWLVTSGRSVAQLGISTTSGAAAGVAAGGAGGFVGGTLSGVAEGKSWGEAALLGLDTAKTGALWGGILGGAAGFLSGAVREIGYLRMKQSLLRGLDPDEVRGLRFTMRGLENRGFRVQGSLEYNQSRHGIDLWARGLGRRSGTLAVAEAKASGSLGSLGHTSYGRQAGPMWVGTSATRAAEAGIRGGQEVLDALKAGNLDMYIGLAGTEGFGMVNTTVWTAKMPTMNFRQFPNAVIWL